jgi:hypothetical protein
MALKSPLFAANPRALLLLLLLAGWANWSNSCMDSCSPIPQGQCWFVMAIMSLLLLASLCC